jgi:hypothetical protein
MKITALKNMFKEFYGLDIPAVTLIMGFLSIAQFARPFMGIIIDARFVPKRKYYMVFFSFASMVL